MGNYYEGKLEFTFKPEHSIAIDNIIDIFKIIHKYKDDICCRDEKYIEYIKSNKNNFTKGLDLYRDAHGDIRNFYDCYMTIHNPKTKDEACEGYGLLDLLIDVYFAEEENIIEEEYPYLPNKINDVNYESIVKAVCKSWDERYNIKSKLQFSIVINVCEKYNGDKNLTELIELWSPYLDENYNDGYIGTIEDEDRTFRKDYYVGNKVHETHWEFCGEWCDYYNTNVRCKDMKCRNAYDLGKNSKEE